MSGDFGRYRLAQKIGEGGLAEVYRAQTEGGPTVALKRLARAHLDSAELAGVFASETQIAAAMQGPRLLGSIDSGDVDGWPFLVMPIAQGGSLADALKGDAGLERKALRRLVSELGEALAAMHDLGYVHGDLSPGNVLFAEDRSALLGDFSAATLLGTTQHRPQGTFSYMSPEQVRGNVMDARSDVFSLATLLWECTSGQRIFWREAQHLSFVAVVESTPPPMPREHAECESILLSALAKDPASRPASIEQFCRALLAAF